MLSMQRRRRRQGQAQGTVQAGRTGRGTHALSVASRTAQRNSGSPATTATSGTAGAVRV